MTPQDVPLLVTWYEDATVIARALGLDIDLPDVGCRDPEYWAKFDRKAWRHALKGKVAMIDEDIDRTDPDWIRLIQGDGYEVWFDLETGVCFRCTVGTVGRVVDLIRLTAAEKGVRLADDWPGYVYAMRGVYGGGAPDDEDIAPLLEAAGFIEDKRMWRLRADGGPSRH